MHEVTGSTPVTPTTLQITVNIGRNDVYGVVVLTPRKTPSGHLVATFAGHLRFGGRESPWARKALWQADGRDWGRNSQGQEGAIFPWQGLKRTPAKDCQ